MSLELVSFDNQGLRIKVVRADPAEITEEIQQVLLSLELNHTLVFYEGANLYLKFEKEECMKILLLCNDIFLKYEGIEWSKSQTIKGVSNRNN